MDEMDEDLTEDSPDKRVMASGQKRELEGTD